MTARDRNPEYYGRIPGWSNLSYRRRDQIKRWTLHALTGIGLFFIVSVFFWMISTSLRPTGEMFTRPVPYVPETWTLKQYRDLFTGTRFVTYYLNSIFVSMGVIIITTSIATLGGYGLTRIDIPFKKGFARTILFGYMFPPILLAIPMFIFWRQFGLVDSYIGLILAETAISLPFSLWMMWKFFQTVPIALEESAMMSGASQFRAFYDIALPLAKPGMIAVAVYSYAVAWNEYTIPRVLMVSVDKWPLTVGVFTFTQKHNVMWGQVMAASALVILPSLIFVFFLQKYLLRAFSTV